MHPYDAVCVRVCVCAKFIGIHMLLCVPVCVCKLISIHTHIHIQLISAFRGYGAPQLVEALPEGSAFDSR
jgi:hypothetical protein